MKEYIGTKMIQAEPAQRFIMASGTTVTVPHGVDKLQITKEAIAWEDGYKVVYPDGYASWSPKDVFEAAYRETNGMNFGLAIEAAKMGKRISRAGWNGKGMFLYYVPAAAYPPATDVAKEAFGGENVPYGAYIAMKTAQGNVVPWVASQTDMLADDWYIVESAASKGTAEAEQNKILAFCIQVTEITDAEIQELRDIAQGQMEYLNPLRMATTARQNELGRYNQAVLDALLNLKAVIESGESI